jgi:hypothetical protein
MKYGWRQEPEQRTSGYPKLGVRFSAFSGKASDLRPFSPSQRHDQQITSACCAESFIRALEIKRIIRYGQTAHVPLSVLAAYYLAREMMVPSETSDDDGTFISMVAEIVRRFGVCPDVDWPFQELDGTDLNHANPESKLYKPPTWVAMREAYIHKIDKWFHIASTGSDRVDDVISVLAAGSPVPYGTQIGKEWQSYQAGQVLGLPQTADGGHATAIVGWDPNLLGGVFIGENSWGNNWGDNGFYLLAPEVVASGLSGDFIAIQGGWEDWAVAA